MLTYNTQQRRLPLPEYGRNIQRMVDHCLTIEDREMRNAAARQVIASMSALFPALANDDRTRHKLWDHLAIMSDFKLDIDYPWEVVRPEELNTKPEHLDYHQCMLEMRHYGRLLIDMIDRACQYPEGEERDALVLLLANHAKKQLLALNADGVEDRRIFDDFARISGGQIHLSPETTRLHEFQVVAPPAASKKKKRKK